MVDGGGTADMVDHSTAGLEMDSKMAMPLAITMVSTVAGTTPAAAAASPTITGGEGMIRDMPTPFAPPTRAR